MIVGAPTGSRRGAILAATALAVLVLSTASASATPPGGPKPSRNGAQVTLTTTQAKAGGRIGVKGTKFPASKSVTVKLDDDKVGVVAVLKVDRRGRFSGSVTIPRNVTRVVKPGRHHLRFLAPASTVNHQSNTSVEKPFTLVRATARAAAVADPVTFPDVNGGGATITLDASRYAPGARVEITGAGFTGTDGHGGVRLLLKPDDDAFAVASYGGADAVTPGDAGGHATFSSEEDGTLSGWITLPGDLPAAGPGTAAHAGQHWLRGLAGTYGNPTAPKSFQAWFAVDAPPSATLPATAVAPGTALPFAFAGFVQSAGGGQHVAIKLDDGAIVACVAATADGSGSGAIALPATLAAGAHTLRFLGGTDCVSGAGVTEPPARTALASFTVSAPAPAQEPPPPPSSTSPAVLPPVTIPPAAIPPAPIVASVRLASAALRTAAGRIAIRLTGRGEAAKAEVSITTASRLRLRPRHGTARIVTLVTPATPSIAAGRTVTVRLRLTRDGRALLARLTRVRVRVTIRLGAAKPVATTLTLRRGAAR